MRILALLPHLIDFMVDLCTPGPISKPGAVGEVGEDELLLIELED